ncbi:MAG: 2-phospho-L-lactate transferase [Phototrophicales bacterium]|nr:MAG: 2-phospho-L-lactate transferase [Phototrophicales bacterium]RMG75248.1 MAG: 2-phospho-L-lactate transferase [Chloroflexota bacterium]
MALEKVVLLVGGVGGAKLAYGLYHAMPPENLTVIVNTGDDFWLYGLRICPDVDTITYTLSNRVNKTTGWGVADETFITLETMPLLGETPWFRLGDKDLALHMIRTQYLHKGKNLSEITKHFADSLGIRCKIVPMANEFIETKVDTVEYGELDFQEYFVKYRWQPTLKSLRLAGIDQATLNPIIQDAIHQADMIIVGPSNPWLSINPILSIPGMRDLLRSTHIPRIALTPLIQGQAVKGPTAKIMQEMGLSPSNESVIDYYGDVINGFVYDERDHQPARSLETLFSLDTLMDTEAKRITVAQNLLSQINDRIKL